MKIAFLVASLGAATAFSNHGLSSSKAAFTPLSLLPKKTVSQSFYPFDDESFFAISGARTDDDVGVKGRNKEAVDGSAGVRQLLGVKGASQETNIWKIRLQLTKV
jgi:hypothetical protein